MWFYVPFALQGLLMVVDEFYLHEERVLPTWERLGHPLDSLSMAIPLSLAAFIVPSEASILSFTLLAIFSCVFITKDEWVHAQECRPIEQWVHSLLFVLHPFVFLSTAWIWLREPKSSFLLTQWVIVITFMCYQIIRWSIPWRRFAK